MPKNIQRVDPTKHHFLCINIDQTTLFVSRILGLKRMKGWSSLGLKKINLEPFFLKSNICKMGFFLLFLPLLFSLFLPFIVTSSLHNSEYICFFRPMNREKRNSKFIF